METKPAFSAAVVEVLKQDNYLDWCVRVKTSLMALGVWDIVESPENEAGFMVWNMRNAMALQVIQNSCGPDTFSNIREITSARIAWNTLAEKYKPKGPGPSSSMASVPFGGDKPSSSMASVPLEGDNIDSGESDNEGNIDGAGEICVESDKDGSIDDDFEIYLPLYRAVQLGKWHDAKEFIKRHPQAISAKITAKEKTALHVAAEAGHVRIVEELVNDMSAETLEIRDNEGFTALGRAACKGNYPMAECMLGKSAKLTSIQIERGYIPVVAALYNGHLELARFLYKQTPNEILMLEDGIVGATVVCEAIYNKALDIALGLLRSCPGLVVARDRNGDSPFYALACMPDYFPSGNRLVFWKRWICYGINVEEQRPCEEIHWNIRNLAGNQSNDNETSGSGISVEEQRPCEEIRLNIQNLAGNQSNDNETSGAADYCSPTNASRSGSSHFKPCPLLLNVWNIGLSLLSRLVSILQTLLGIKHLYEVKLTHVQSCEILLLMMEELSYLNIPQMGAGRVQESIVRATKEGIFEFVCLMLEVHPLLVWTQNATSSTIFSVAVEYRRAKIFSLIYRLDMKNALASSTDFAGNNLLHMAGMSAASTSLNDIPGAALKMQRELQWFKEVESIVPSLVRGRLNTMKLTPRQLFTKNHEDMMSKGENWMKDTAASSTVVGALIVTIMFAVVFTVPGGNDQNKGFPIFLNKKLFMVFIVSDALSLFSSSTSVLMFLGILTSRYAEEDFLESLPRKMIIGLSTLFFSIVAMMTTFTAALLLMLHEQSWILEPIICLASIPITLFVLMQFPLLVAMAISTYGPSIFDRKIDRKISMLDRKIDREFGYRVRFLKEVLPFQPKR